MIPNVSSIYRDLACISDPLSQRNNQATSFSSPEQNYRNQKQQRHNTLMERLKNAQLQAQNMNSELGLSYSKGTTSYKQYSYASNEQSYQPSLRSETRFFPLGSNQSGSNRSWRPPKIKYRHIQDFKQPTPMIQQTHVQQIKKRNLENEFYEEAVPKNRQNVKNQVGTGPENKAIQSSKQDQLEKQSQTSYGRTWVNRQSKFEDKLESYFELCRKRPVSSKVENPKQSISRGKFQRTSNKVVGMDLEKALKLLSFD